MSQPKPMYFKHVRQVEGDPIQIASQLNEFIKGAKEDFTIKVSWQVSMALETLYVAEPKDSLEVEAVEWFKNLEPEAALAQLTFRFKDWLRDQRKHYHRSVEK